MVNKRPILLSLLARKLEEMTLVLAALARSTNIAMAEV
jgi:hypothetical protein